MNMKKILILSALSAFVAACSSVDQHSLLNHDQPAEPEVANLWEGKPVGNGIYHWKTTFAPTDAEEKFLADNNLSRCYLRFFDVDYEPSGEFRQPEIIPVGTTRFLQSVPGNWEIVPTIYLTQDAIYAMEGKTLQFSDQIVQRIVAMARRHKLSDRIREVQFDCDWSRHSEGIYFELCRHAQRAVTGYGWQLSATIRLHQLAQTPPPVDCGTLMVYNTGAIKNPDTENSILSLKDIEPYIRKVRYALPLDIAYPTFGWGIWFRKGKFRYILHKTDFGDEEFYKPLGDNRFRVVKEHYVENHKLMAGDEIRLEKSDIEELKKVKQAIDRAIPEQRSVILYHLDETNLKNYTPDEIHSLYTR